MIERLGASATGQGTAAIEPVIVPAVPGVSEAQPTEMLVHNGSRIGETSWMGAMNAFRIAKTLAQQQLCVTTRPVGAAPEQNTNASKSAPIPQDNALSPGSIQTSEPGLIPTITQTAEDQPAANYLQ